MTPREYAGWLADKIQAYGDYAKEAASVLIRQADEIERLRDAKADILALYGENNRLRQLAIAIEADSTEPKHRREWARELLTPNVEPHPPHRQCGCADCAPSFEPYPEPPNASLTEPKKPIPTGISAYRDKNGDLVSTYPDGQKRVLTPNAELRPPSPLLAKVAP